MTNADKSLQITLVRAALAREQQTLTALQVTQGLKPDDVDLPNRVTTQQAVVAARQASLLQVGG